MMSSGPDGFPSAMSFIGVSNSPREIGAWSEVLALSLRQLEICLRL